MASHGQFPIRSAEEAAALISHGASLGIGGFTDPGCPHAVPRALAQRAREFHERGKPFQVRILSGAEAGPAVDVDLPQADTVSFRMPFQGEKACRDAINAGKIDFADIHLSHCSQQLFEGFFGKIDFAVIEASDLSDDGRVYFTTAIGNGPTYLRLAEKVVIEINRHHPTRVREFSDILILPLPPHREPIPIRHPLDRIGAPHAMVDPAKVVAVVETDEGSTRQPSPARRGEQEDCRAPRSFFSRRARCGPSAARVSPAAERSGKRWKRSPSGYWRASRPAFVYGIHRGFPGLVCRTHALRATDRRQFDSPHLVRSQAPGNLRRLRLLCHADRAASSRDLQPPDDHPPTWSHCHQYCPRG